MSLFIISNLIFYEGAVRNHGGGRRILQKNKAIARHLSYPMGFNHDNNLVKTFCTSSCFTRTPSILKI